MGKKEKKFKNKNKVDLSYNLELERKDSKDVDKKEYDFIARSAHLTGIDEQKIKVREIEENTK